MEMNDDENKTREWFIFSSSSQSRAHPCLVPPPQLPGPWRCQWPCESICHWWPGFSLLPIQMLNKSKKCLFQITSLTQSLLYEKSRTANLSLLNPPVILKTGSSTSQPVHEIRNLFSKSPTGLKNRGRGFQLGEPSCKYTKYFYSFLVLGKGINFPLKKCWKLPGKTSRSLIKRKSHQL